MVCYHLMICRAESKKVTESDAEDFTVSYALEKDITVSTNLFVRWYANKGLFWGSIGDLVVVLGGIGVLIARKKKKAAKAN